MRRLPIYFLLVSSAFSSGQDFGPIETRNHRAISLAFLRFEPRPNFLPPGIREWSLSYTSANDFRQLGAVAEDYELQRIALRYRALWRDGMEWSVEVPFLSRGGGWQDPLIDWWHENVLHWSDPLRNSTPFGRSQVSIPGRSFNGSADGLGDITLMLAKPLTKCLTGSFAIKLPTGNARNLLGSGAPDAGVYLQGQFPIARRLNLHAQLGLVLQGKSTELDDARPWLHQEGFSLVWQRNSRDAWIAQWQGESSALRSGVPGSDATHRLLTFGYKRKLSSHQMLDLFFSEDRDVFNGKLPEGANIGPDFTMGVRLSIRF